MHEFFRSWRQTPLKSDPASLQGSRYRLKSHSPISWTRTQKKIYDNFVHCKVTPFVKESDLRDVPIPVRQCLYSNEFGALNSSSYWVYHSPSLLVRGTRKSIFATYSQEACLFECLLEKAAEVTRCIPWFFSPLQGMGPF